MPNTWQEAYEEGIRDERERWRTVLMDRINDLDTCTKDDNCHLIAQGVDLALGDGLWDESADDE